MFKIHFRYIGVGAVDVDRGWGAYCFAVPRIGEKIRPARDQTSYVIVRDVVYRFVKDEAAGDYVQYITVVVSDAEQPWPPPS